MQIYKLFLFTVKQSLGNITLTCDAEQSQYIVYQCTVEGISMGWAIEDKNGSNGCESEYTNDDTVNITRQLSCATDFNTTLLFASDTHLVSTISFKLQSSLIGYTVKCFDVSKNTKECTIQGKRIQSIVSKLTGIIKHYILLKRLI